MRSREANKKAIVITQERDGDAWGQGILLEVKRRVWMLDLFWRRSLHDWIWGVMERAGVKEDGSLTNGESWGWSFGGRPEQVGFVKREMLLEHQGGDVEGPLDI